MTTHAVNLEVGLKFLQTLVSFLQEFVVTTHAVNLEIGLKFVHTPVSFLQELVVTTHAVENEAKKNYPKLIPYNCGGFEFWGGKAQIPCFKGVPFENMIFAIL